MALGNIYGNLSFGGGGGGRGGGGRPGAKEGGSCTTTCRQPVSCRQPSCREPVIEIEYPRSYGSDR